MILAPMMFAAACSSSPPEDADPAGAPGVVGVLPDEAREIMEKPAYATARWIYYVADQETGEVLLSDRPDEMVFTGSTAKEFTVGTVYDTIGADATVTTPVYATAPPADGVVTGDLVLVASGDLALGGRGALEGRVDHTFTATTIDHVYGNIAPNATVVPDDPLAGLDDLARQVAESGVTQVNGDVVVDTRLWETFQGQEGPVPPIFVNDNILDIEVSPGAVGQPGTLETRPPSSAFTVRSEVTTVGSDEESALQVEADPADPRTILVSGSIPEGAPQLTIYRVPDAAQWARTLFVEALGRAGVTVTAPALGPNDQAALPEEFPTDQQLAALESPPLSAFGTMVLETSYNTGANALLCLLAATAGSTTCTDGLTTIREAIDKSGIDSDAVVLIDGQGADPASITPRQMAGWVKWAAEQPWGPEFVAGQPVLGETGTLAAAGSDSPAKGKVAAKTGTSAAVDPATGRVLFNVQSLAGYLTTDEGRKLVFALSMSGGTFADVLTGISESGADVALVGAALQQAVP
jgi:D-alanyl-D-alanine carboxypeptidase/D-alanyl-D-alanine-endopeptidase (penicillin-binding protein 4)